MTNNKTLYEILNVNPEASINEIKAGFRKLALKYHPDKNNNTTDSQALFRIIHNAYKTLLSADARKEYDNYLKTSSVIRNRVKSGNSAAPMSRGHAYGNDSLEYFYTQLNYILWEIEDILNSIKDPKSNIVVSGRSIKQWLLEILFFIDKWVFEPTGFIDYFYEARKIKNEKSYDKIIGRADTSDYQPYVSFEDYFYDIRRRMNKFIDKTGIDDIMKTANGYQVRIIDNMIEAFNLSYYYLGYINLALKGETISIYKFRHTNNVYEKQHLELPVYKE
jgi:curved DNA-binding protein CbpA